MASKRPSAVHAEWWSADEQVMLRGVWPHGTDKQRMAIAARMVGDELDMMALQRDELNDFLRMYPDKAIAISEATELALLQSMVLKDGTLLRYEPTSEQAAAGLPGDAIPFDGEWFSNLSARDWNYLVAEATKRSDSVAVQAEEETRAEDVPTVSPLPSSANGGSAVVPVVVSVPPLDISPKIS